MALERQIISIPIDGGVDTKTDSFLTEMGFSLKLENARFEKTGRLSKRYGLEILSSEVKNFSSLDPIDTINPRRILSEGGFVGVQGSNQAVLNNATDTFVNTTSIQWEAPLVSSSFMFKDFVQDFINPAICLDSDNEVLVGGYTANNADQEAAFALINLDSGSKIVKSPLTSTSGRYIPAFLKDNGETRYFFIWYNGTATICNYAWVNEYGEQLGVDSIPLTTLRFNVFFTDDYIYVCTLTPTLLRIDRIKFDGTRETQITVSLPVNFNMGNSGYGIYFDGTTLFICYDTVSATQYILGVNPDSGAITYTTSIAGTSRNGRIGLCVDVFKNRAIVSHNDTADVGIRIEFIDLTGSQFSYTASSPFTAIATLSTPFIRDGEFLIPVYSFQTIQANAYLITPNGSIVSMFNYGQCPVFPRGASGILHYLPSTVVEQNQVYIPVDKRFVASGLLNFPAPTTGVGYAELDFTKDYRAGNKFTIGLSRYMSDGQLFFTDKSIIFEAPFLFNPPAAPIGTIQNNTPHIGAGTYRYCYILEYTDINGQKFRSQPSPIANNVTVTSTQRVLLTAFNNRIIFTTGIAVTFYRTANGASIFYKLGTVLMNGSGSPSFIDGTTDAVLTSRETLYTTGGVLQNDPPPSSRFGCVGGSRMFLGGLEQRDQIAYSKKILDGEGINFSDFFRIKVGDSAQDVTGLGYMDGKIIIFKEDQIYFVQGDGPNELGLQDDFTGPELISSDGGCVEPRSIVNFSGGLFYKSSKGIYLLGRNLACQYIGAPVEDFNSEKIIAALNVEKLSETRFYTEQGNCLVFNDQFSRWSVYKDQTKVDADIYKDTVAMIMEDSVMYEKIGLFVDDSDYYPMTTVTSWIKFSQIQGFQRITNLLILGNFKSDHQLQVKVYYNYADSSPDTYTITATNLYQFNIHLKRQKCEALKIEIKDINQADGGESFNLSNIQLYAGVKKGNFKLPVARRY